MGRIRQRDTAAELRVRSLFRKEGLHYRTNNPDLPGRPDLANRRQHWAAFVHGCFWHGHEGCLKATIPKRNREFWQKKFARNRERDAQSESKLRERGFRVIVLWECELDNEDVVRRKVRAALNDLVRQ